MLLLTFGAIETPTLLGSEPPELGGYTCCGIACEAGRKCAPIGRHPWEVSFDNVAAMYLSETEAIDKIERGGCASVSAEQKTRFRIILVRKLASCYPREMRVEREAPYSLTRSKKKSALTRFHQYKLKRLRVAAQYIHPGRRST